MFQLKTIIFFIFSILSVGFMMFFSSCSKQNEKRKRVKEGDTIAAGLAFPEIRSTQNDTVKLALYPSASFFFIDLGLKNSDGYIKLIKEANKADVPVRVRVYKDNRAEVAEIIPATNQEVEKYQNH